MNHDGLSRSLEAYRTYDAHVFAPALSENERRIIESKQAILGFYRLLSGLEVRLRAMEMKLGYVYHPSHWQPVPVRYKDDGGDAGGGGDDGGSGNDAGGDDGDSDSGFDDGGDGGEAGSDDASGDSHYNPDEPRVPAGNPNGGEWTTGGADEGIQDSEDPFDMAQEIFPPLLMEGSPVTPPFETFPEDPTISPGDGWIWKGNGPPGTQGNWINPETGEKLNPDLDHDLPHGPHWDYTDPEGNEYRWKPDGTMEPKVLVGGIIA